MVLSKSWLLLTLPLAVLALVLLTLTAFSLLRTTRRSVVASLPVHAEQSITLDDAAVYVLNVEGDSLNRVATGLNFAVAKAGSASTLRMWPILVRTKVSSFSRTRLELFSFETPAPGVYTLRTTGMNPNADYSRAAIVITKPITVALVLHVLGLVGLGVMLIGSLVVTGLVLAKRPLSASTEGGVSRSASQSMDSAIAQAAAVLHATATVNGNAVRFVVVEVLCGVVAPEIAGAGHPGGLLLDLRSLNASGYIATDGQEVVVLLAQLPPSAGDAPPTMVMGAPQRILVSNGDKFVYAHRDAAGQREYTLPELRQLCGGSGAGAFSR